MLEDNIIQIDLIFDSLAEKYLSFLRRLPRLNRKGQLWASIGNKAESQTFDINLTIFSWNLLAIIAHWFERQNHFDKFIKQS